MMRSLATLLTLLLLASLGLPGAAADDVRVDVWQRLLKPRDEPARPLLGLLGAIDPRSSFGVSLDPDPDERPGHEENEEDEEHENTVEFVSWLLSRGRGQAVAEGRFRRVAVDAEIRAPGGQVHRVRLVSAPGRRALLSCTRALRVVTDYSAEIACDNSGGLRPSAVGDPWLASLLEGLALDVRPFLVDRKRVALEVLLQAGRFERPVARLDTRALFLGDIDLPRYRGVLLSASGTTSVGEPLALSVANADGERYAVRLTPRMLDLPESEDRGRRLVHRLDAGFLIAPRTVLGFSRIRDPYFNPPAHVLPAADWMDPVADRALLWDHIDRVLPRAEMRLLPEGDVCLVANEDTVAEVGRTFDAWASDAARTVRVEITARAGDEVIGRVDVPVLTGRTAFFRLGEDQTVLSDADVEVG